MVYQASDLAACERIEKMSRTLASGGHEAILLCNDYADAPAGEERLGAIPVTRVGPRFASRRLSRILKFPLFLNPLWVLQMAATVKRFQADAIQEIGRASCRE